MILKSQKAILLFSLIGGFTICCTACRQEKINLSGSSVLEIYLADLPADYQAVRMDIRQIMISISSSTTDDSGWIEIPLVRTGLYNVLDFRNGRDTLLGKAALPTGTVSQIRLILGKGNQLILKDGSVIPLEIPSAEESGLKLTVHTILTAGASRALVLDFDAARSIIRTEKSGQYLFRPVIHTFLKGSGAALEGRILPDTVQVRIIAVTNTDTLGAIPDPDGYYRLDGMPADTYQLLIIPDPLSGFMNDTLNNIQVHEGSTTTVDTVRLRPAGSPDIQKNI